MLQLILVYFGPGLLLDYQLWGGSSAGRFTAVTVTFIINYACYFSEIYRGGIESISKGQYEAGQVLGLTRRQIFFKIVLLQVVKRIIPPMGNEFITLVKDTSLARIISVYELIWAGVHQKRRHYLAAVYDCDLLSAVQRRAGYHFRADRKEIKLFQQLGR